MSKKRVNKLVLAFQYPSLVTQKDAPGIDLKKKPNKILQKKTPIKIVRNNIVLHKL